ncbi:prephenate dehydratase domain-containing protein, partial [Bacteriovoracaceae bacterium]|nr:prephenate dehydratase domain-containing protein [Bacteriovoracaceae bacterium]
MKVAFQGSRGAYSEEAIYRYFGEDVTPVGFELSEQVFEAVVQQEVATGLVPVENSIVGNVNVNLELFNTLPVFAFAEVYHPIKHYLLSHKGARLDEIEKVHSHPIALAQCRDYLNRHNIQSIPDFDTAGSCKLLKDRSHFNEGTIASRLCAEFYDLDIIDDDIQKVQNNITRFLVFTREDEVPSAISQEKTSLSFSTKHHPGALLNCLQTFKNFDLNLTKLESRPIPENPFEYYFFVDLLAGINDP